MNAWASRIRELEALGWSLKAIGEAIGLAVSSVSDIKRGASQEPRGMAAVQLHALHIEETAKAKSEAEPTTPEARAA